MRHHLRPLQNSPGWWVLEDAEIGMQIRFRECHFNDTQEVTFTDPDAIGRLGASGVAKMLQEAAQWLYLHAYNVAMPDEPKFMLQLGAQDDRLMLCREKFPRFVVHVMDNCNAVKLGDALIHAGYFIKKNPDRYREFSDASRASREFSDPDGPDTPEED